MTLVLGAEGFAKESLDRSYGLNDKREALLLPQAKATQ